MKKLTVLALSAALFSTTAFANSNVVYSCTTMENLPVVVKKEGNNYVFSYDKMTFKNPIKEALKNPESEIAGGSQFTTATLELRNKGYSYVIGHIEPRGNPKGAFEASFTLKETKTGRVIETFECLPNKPIKHNFDRKLMQKSGFAA